MAWLFDFRGSVGRLEWWAIQFICIAINIAGGLLILAMAPELFQMPEELTNKTSIYWVELALILPLSAASFWIAIAATIKRFHDRGRSGFWLVILLIPALLDIPLLDVIVAVGIIIDCGFLAGDDDNNLYATAPKSMSKAELFQSVKDGAGVRPEVRALNSASKPTTRKPVKINRPNGPVFGRRKTRPTSS